MLEKRLSQWRTGIIDNVKDLHEEFGLFLQLIIQFRTKVLTAASDRWEDEFRPLEPPLGIHKPVGQKKSDELGRKWKI